nr:carcinoembryonic antigen-related cell adhesion molecule 5-like [Nothobranchius furzeri]
MSDRQYVTFLFTWDGGAPRALTWWEEPGAQTLSGKEESNILVLRYGTVQGGKPYTCYAKHPLMVQPKTCKLTPVGPDVPHVDVAPYRRTEYGYSVLETENASLSCGAQSNPASQYLWFYNKSQIYIGPQFTINRILRMFAGNYTCLAQNSYLNTRSKKTIRLIIYSWGALEADAPRKVAPEIRRSQAVTQDGLRHTAERFLVSRAIVTTSRGT